VAALTATDLEVTFVKHIPCAGGALKKCIPAKVLYSEIKALPSNVLTVELSFDESVVRVNGRCDIFTASADEFPEAFVPDSPFVPVRNFSDALKRVVCAASDDDTRYVLNSVYCDMEHGKMVGTDGYRLHLDDIVAEGGQPLIIPIRAARLLAKHPITDGLAMHAGENQTTLVFDLAGGKMTARAMTGDYPDYRQVWPSDLPVEVCFSSKDFLSSLDGADPLSAGIVALTINGSLKVESDGDNGAYKWEIPCEVKSKPEGVITYKFRPSFLLDALKSFPRDRVVFQGGGIGACLINGKTLVMPLKD
jgi:DNA polymerase III sliding clamp (beta) subunit (PCNA family)